MSVGGDLACSLLEAAVRAARSTEFISPSLMRKIGRTNFDSPTFKKLFSHQTWQDYIGANPFDR